MNGISIRDFQSLEAVDLDFGQLTVLVGPSNSGKSAVLRAIRAVVKNVSRPRTVVRHGKTRTEIKVGPLNISAFPEDEVWVHWARGASHSTYAVETRSDTRQYTKAGTSVPEDIARLFRFVEVEGEDLNFALQFDRPFLLDAPATKVAKVFGDLTGINVIFNAAREANRRRLEVVNLLKVRRQDMETLRDRASQYEGLGERHKRIVAANERYVDAVAVESKMRYIEQRIDVVEKAEAVLEHYGVLPEPPSLDGIEEQVSRLADLNSLVERYESAGDPADISKEIAEIEAQVEAMDRQYHQALVKEGVCPLCGQAVS